MYFTPVLFVTIPNDGIIKSQQSQRCWPFVITLDCGLHHTLRAATLKTWVKPLSSTILMALWFLTIHLAILSVSLSVVTYGLALCEAALL